MGKRQLNRLSARTVLTKKRPGLYCDGGGLYLQIAPAGTKTWIFRYRSPLTKKLRYMGLGSIQAVGLPMARTAASAQRGLLSSGLDPIRARDEEIARRAMEAAKAVTFAACASSYIESHKAGWRNEKHAEQWTETIETYCGPVFGTLPVQDVDRASHSLVPVQSSVHSEGDCTPSKRVGRHVCCCSSHGRTA